MCIGALAQGIAFQYVWQILQGERPQPGQGAGAAARRHAVGARMTDPPGSAKCWLSVPYGAFGILTIDVRQWGFLSVEEAKADPDFDRYVQETIETVRRMERKREG